MRLSLRRMVRVVAATALLLPVSALGAEIEEYQAKAVFLYKFATFVEWPPESFQPGRDSLAICILGQSAFEQTLDNTVRNRQIEGRRVLVRQVADAKQVPACHLLFVTGSAIKQFRALRQENSQLTGVLVVGESEGFAREGGIINFKLDEGRLRIEINLAEAKRGKLEINSRLLSMADVLKK